MRLTHTENKQECQVISIMGFRMKELKKWKRKNVQRQSPRLDKDRNSQIYGA